MAALDFPSSPTNGQQYTANGNTWTYDSAMSSWVAANGNVVTVDGNGNATITGVYVMGSSFIRNRIINPCCSIDQRNSGVSTVVADAAYGPDRWKMLGEDSLGKLKGKDTTVGGGRFNGVVTCVTANNKYGVAQYIEGVNCKDLRGKTVTLSAVLSVSNTRLGNIKMGIVEWTGTEDSMTSDMVTTWGADGTTPTLATNYAFKNTPANLSVTTTATKYTVSVTLGSTFNNLAVFIWNDDKAFTANDEFYFTDVQIEEGSISTPIEKRQHGHELALCQRYFNRWTSEGNNYTGITLSIHVNGNLFVGMWYLPVEMRALGTCTTSAIGTFANNPSSTLSSTSFIMKTRQIVETAINTPGGSGTAILQSNNTTTAWANADAEL